MLYRIGLAYLNIGKYNESINIFRNITHFNPGYVFYALGVAHTKNGLYENASREFDKAINFYETTAKIKPNHSKAQKNLADAWNGKGIALLSLGNYDEAIKDYDKATDLNPQLADAWNNKGNAHLLLDNYDEAIKDYDNATDLNPQFADAWKNKGNALLSRDNYYEAIKAYDKAIELKYITCIGKKPRKRPRLSCFHGLFICYVQFFSWNRD